MSWLRSHFNRWDLAYWWLGDAISMTRSHSGIALRHILHALLLGSSHPRRWGNSAHTKCFGARPRNIKVHTYINCWWSRQSVKVEVIVDVIFGVSGVRTIFLHPRGIIQLALARIPRANHHATSLVGRLCPPRDTVCVLNCAYRHQPSRYIHLRYPHLPAV
ncbi:unnamed protein product [Periconia digitata]|uniref:Uncharacterized protein n=1 Tax=Periconia digitata TaxID=1303443 RepID=A0A9W4UGM1_9PLEO|nr:unnamed protein product [Periconia digitata]